MQKNKNKLSPYQVIRMKYRFISNNNDQTYPVTHIFQKF